MDSTNWAHGYKIKKKDMKVLGKRCSGKEPNDIWRNVECMCGNDTLCTCMKFSTNNKINYFKPQRTFCLIVIVFNEYSVYAAD